MGGRSWKTQARLVGLLGSLIQLTAGLRFSSVQVPALVQRGANFWLGCQFELAPGEQLYGAKWYKDNQEFYRLEPDAHNKQQYFGQLGVNVMMSWSNATHVRLLNASLESEGAYACEISTQNLSTIRYEREIRLYVLAGSRPSVIGFRSRYALGDWLELHCASDFSRPKAALAWFINGRLIAQSSEWFQLEQRTQAGKGGLLRSNLALKFKLAAGVWRALGQEEPAANQGNQSLGAPTAERQLLAYQLQPLSLQCRYKLTEISDLTFNELLVRPPAAGRRWSERRQQAARLPDGRIGQAPSPAGRAELRRALEAAATPAACQLGGLALQPDDPLLVGEAEEPAAGWAPGQTLRLSCSSAAALLAEQTDGRTDEHAFCSDGAQRRRLAISGRAANEQPDNNWRRPAARLAYLSLSAVDLAAAAAKTSETSADWPPESAESAQDAWRAPPLLEWFINNQEAPAAPPPPDGAAQPLDYTQYFANFDSKPADRQQLPLVLTLDKRHFMTPDSNLRLRCSSTQAQVLAVDSINLLIVPLAPGQQPPGQHKAHRLHYQTRRPPQQARAASGGAVRPTILQVVACATLALYLRTVIRL